MANMVTGSWSMHLLNELFSMLKSIGMWKAISEVPADILIVGKFCHPGCIRFFESPQFNIS